MRNLYAFFLFIFCTSFTLPPENGIEYEHIKTRAPQSIHVLKVDLKKAHILLARALDTGLGRESVESIASRHNALCAINAGFFKIGTKYDGMCMGICKVKDDIFGLPYKMRGTIGWKSGKAPIFDLLLCKCDVKIDNVIYTVDGFNRPRGNEKEIILYSDAFGKTTLSSFDSKEIEILDDKVQNIYPNGSSKIKENGYVLSMHNSTFQKHFCNVSKGQDAHVTFSYIPKKTSKDAWKEQDYIISGACLLVQDKEVIEDFKTEDVRSLFFSGRHARTAIGVLADERLIFVVVDGRQPLKSTGLTIPELCQLMKSFGCIHALNLDGGGSSTMVINNEIVNSPCGDEDEDDGQKKSRRVSDAILIMKGT